MEEEAKRFMNEILWNGKVMDLITSRKTFLNYNLATMIYQVPPPAGTSAADGMAFGETTLPADQRSGLLTNAGFHHAHGAGDRRRRRPARPRREGSVLVPRDAPSARGSRLAGWWAD